MYYYIQGTLGSTRVMTTSDGTPCFDAEYYPYGREKDFVNNCSQDFKFTGKERDPETGLDNFGARYYASSYARFMSPDPGHAGAVLANPESWDAYSYVLNNPETLTDPSGTAPCPKKGSCVDTEQRILEAWLAMDNPLWAIDNPFAPSWAAQQQDSGQTQGQQQEPSWDPNSPLPKDPSGLGPGWTKDTGHQAPNDERWVDGKGDKLDWHKGIPGATGWMGKDHWHWLPGGRKGKQGRHYSPGDTIRKTTAIGAVGAAIVVTVHAIIDTAPEWGPFAIP